MIDNGTLVHAKIDASLQTWQPESPIVSALITSVLATVLSLQATSIIYDLLLGNKPRGQVSAPNLHMLLLADEGSPLSVAAAVLRRDELDRVRFHGEIPVTTTIVRHASKIERSTFLKLVLVLLTAPVIGLIAVFLEQGHNKDVSFAEAGFGNVAFGFDPDPKLRLDRDDYAADCTRFRVNFSHTASEQAQFTLCFDTSKQIELDSRVQTSKVELQVGRKGELISKIFVAGTKEAFEASVHVDFSSRNEVYRIAANFSPNDLEGLLEFVTTYIEKRCPPVPVSSSRELVENVPQSSTAPPTNGTSVRQASTIVSREVSCPPPSDAITFGFYISGSLHEAPLTLVNTETFQVANIRDFVFNGNDPDWFNGENLTLLVQRRSFVPFGVLCVVVAVLIVLRFLVEVVANNDVYDGIDEMVAKSAGLANSYEMLRSDILLRYDHKYQRGLNEPAHYGIPKTGMLEVPDFSGGSIGLTNLDE